MTNAWVASDSVNLLQYTCKPLYSSHIHFPVSEDFFGNQKTLGFSSHAMVSRFIAQVIVKVWIWLVQRQTYKLGGEYSFCNLPVSTLSQHSLLEAPGNHWKKHGGTKVSWHFCFFFFFSKESRRKSSKFAAYHERCEPVMMWFSILQNGVIAESVTFGKRSKKLQVVKCLDLARVLSVFL